MLHKAGDTTVIDGASYSYDNAGNRVSKSNYLDNSAEQYVYDDLYQLQQVTRNNAVSESYTYDKVGNRLSSLGVPTYSYNSSNQLRSGCEGGGVRVSCRRKGPCTVLHGSRAMCQRRKSVNPSQKKRGEKLVHSESGLQ